MAKYQLPTSVISPALDIKFADGRLTSSNKETDELMLSLPGWSGKVIMVVVPGLSTDIILGMPWLRKINPRIDWNAGRILDYLGAKPANMKLPSSNIRQNDQTLDEKDPHPVVKAADSTAVTTADSTDVSEIRRREYVDDDDELETTVRCVNVTARLSIREQAAIKALHAV